MASLPNTKTLSLYFLFSVLLLFMHVHGSNARDVKVEQELPKQSEASSTFKEEDSYAGYNSLYNTRKHIHPSQSGFKDDYYAGYNAAYSSRKHIHSSQQEDTNRDSNQYLTGYIHSQKDQKEDGKFYIAAYVNNKRENQPYITQYGGDKRLNQPYITGYINSKRENQPYVIQYGDGKKDSKVFTQDSKDSYLASYKKTEQDSYAATYGKDSKDSYAATYGKDSKDSYEATYGKDSKDSYAATYGKNSKDSYAGTYGKDSKDSYAATYGKDSKDSYVATYEKDSKDSYDATYGKDSKDSYAATYGKESKDSYINSYGKNKLDHTEAFKTGFFTLDDLYVGNMMTLKFPIMDFPNFLTKQEANSIPFSMSRLPSILQLFSINEDSPQAQAMRDTLDQCELEPLTGETKTCVSSLESMTDFVRSIISPEAQLDILTTTLSTPSSVPLQNFTILEVSQDIYSPKWVACHPIPYPYAVFYCHFIGTGSKIFKVQLGSKNGEQVNAVGICHLDTSKWSPGHILFKQLGMKPGDAPVCHFFPVKHLMWVPLPSKATM